MHISQQKKESVQIPINPVCLTKLATQKILFFSAVVTEAVLFFHLHTLIEREIVHSQAKNVFFLLKINEFFDLQGIRQEIFRQIIQFTICSKSLHLVYDKERELNVVLFSSRCCRLKSGTEKRWLTFGRKKLWWWGTLAAQAALAVADFVAFRLKIRRSISHR